MRVEVVLGQGVTWHFPNCVADKFRSCDELTIVRFGDESTRATFYQGEYRHATVYDDLDHVVYCLSAAGQGRKQAL